MGMSAMRWRGWRSRAETYAWRSLAYLYSAFSERSPCARATLISLGSSSCSSCSRAAISSLSFFLIFSVRSIIGRLRHPGGPAWAVRRGLLGYTRSIEYLRGAPQIEGGKSRLGNRPAGDGPGRPAWSSGVGLERLQIRFVGAGNDSERNAQPVPAVDRGNREGQIR